MPFTFDYSPPKIKKKKFYQVILSIYNTYETISVEEKEGFMLPFDKEVTVGIGINEHEVYTYNFWDKFSADELAKEYAGILKISIDNKALPA